MHSCSQKNGLTSFNLDQKKEKALTYSKSFKKTSNFKTKAMFNVLFLNKIEKDSNNYNFLISSYIDKDLFVCNKNDTLGLNFDILDGRNKPIKIEKLQKNDPLMDYFSIKNTWFNYYKISFINTARDVKLNFTYCKEDLGKVFYIVNEE